jgi:hypothetical protein
MRVVELVASWIEGKDVAVIFPARRSTAPVPFDKGPIPANALTLTQPTFLHRGSSHPLTGPLRRRRRSGR